jgi:hypothetical protein
MMGTPAKKPRLWVVRWEQPFQYDFRVQTGMRGRYFWFEGVLSQAPEIETVDAILSPDAQPGQFVQSYVAPMLEAIRRSCTQRAADWRESGGRICSTRVAVKAMREHPADTTLEGVQIRSAWFGRDISSGSWTRAVADCPETWRTETVLRLARGIAAAAIFDTVPILGDALEDAGCDDPLVLDHCRVCRDHSPRCWVVDWILAGSSAPSA